MFSGSCVSEGKQFASWGNVHDVVTMGAAWPKGRVLDRDISLVIIFRPV